jgi:hypothetical protein
MPALAYVGCVEISAHDPDTIYVSATRYKLSDYAPYLFRSTDSGSSWRSINGDFPAGEITRVIRADPVRQGLLFVGTETGVFFSLDDGRVGRGIPAACRWFRSTISRSRVMIWLPVRTGGRSGSLTTSRPCGRWLTAALRRD